MKRKLFLRQRPIIGIDISHTYIKMMSINPSNWKVEGYSSVNADPQKLRASMADSPDYIIELLQELMSKNLVGAISSDQVVIGIPTNITYSRSISLPKAAVKKLEDAVSLEASQYIPVSIDELNLSYEILSETEDTLEVIMSAAPKKIISNISEACSAVGLTVVAVRPSINAVARLVKLVEQGQLPTIIVDIGIADTDVAILNERVRASSSIQIGSNTLTYAISDKLNISLENAHQLKILQGLAHGSKQKQIETAVDKSLTQISDEIHKIIRYYSDRINSSDRIEQVIIVGSGSDIPGIGEYFTNKLIMPARVANPWIKLNFGKLPQPAKQFRPRYISAIGLAVTMPKEVLK